MMISFIKSLWYASQWVNSSYITPTKAILGRWIYFAHFANEDIKVNLLVPDHIESIFRAKKSVSLFTIPLTNTPIQVGKAWDRNLHPGPCWHWPLATEMTVTTIMSDIALNEKA